jgi:phage-related protein (TIGR01555 family)
MRLRDLWPFSRRTDAAPAPPPAVTPSPATALIEQPTRRTRRDWANPATGMGVAGVDPALATYYLATTGISDEDAVDLHRTDPIAKKFLNKPVDEAFSKGFELEITEDDDARDAKGARKGTDERPAQKLKKDIKAKWKALGALKKVRKAWKWSRREGGSAILLGLVDVGAAAGMAAPVAPEGFANLKWLDVIRARDCWPATHYEDPSEDKYGEVETWSVTRRKNGRSSVTLRVHETRLIIFEGHRVVDEAYRGQLHQGFGDSELLPFFRALRRFGTSMAGIEKLLARFGQPHMKMKGLAELMGPDKEGLLNATLDAYEYAASVFNIRVLDGEDDYGTTAPTVSGLPDLVKLVCSELQAASDMPMTILFGDQVGGLGDNGTAVKRDWLDSVAAQRDEHAIPPLTRITELCFRGLGSGKLPGEWEVKGCQLWHPTAKEQADVDKTEADIDAVYLASAVVTPTQVMRRKPVADRYAIDLAALDALEAAQGDMPDDVRDKQAPPDPNADPNAPAVDPAAGGVDVQKTALNGAQVAALLEIIKAVGAKEIARESAVEAVMLAFPGTDRAAAERLLGPEDFEPTKPDPPAPFGGGPPGAPPPKVDPGAEPVPKPGAEKKPTEPKP